MNDIHEGFFFITGLIAILIFFGVLVMKDQVLQQFRYEKKSEVMVKCLELTKKPAICNLAIK